MLILTSEAGLPPDEAARAWDGPAVFVALPGHGLGRAGLEAAEAHATVVESLSPPENAAALIAEVVTRLPHLLREAEEPLLFAGRALSPEALAARRQAGLAFALEPWWEDGRLAGLLLGSALATHPLAAEAVAAARDATTGAAPDAAEAAFVRLLDAALAGTWR